MNYCTVAGYQLAYTRQGQGETVLLVHGITTYSFIWRKIIPPLAKEYDVIAVDLLGCGMSDKPLDVSYAIKDHAERLREFISALGVEKFHFVGHDLGGGMGQIFAVNHSGMLHSLSMMNSVAYDFWPVQPITAMRTPIIRHFLMSAFDLGAFTAFIRKGLYHKDVMTKDLLVLFNAPMQTPEGRKAFLHFAKCLDNHNLMEIEADLRKLTIPVLILRGDADPFLSAVIAEKLHDEIPNSELRRIATAAHFIQEDEPEWVATHLSGFLKDNHEQTD